LLGVYPLRNVHNQRILPSLEKFSQSVERAYLTHNLENQTPAKGFHLSWAPGSESNPNRVQPQEVWIY